jgi:DNA-binding transcriptional LysR family regulator
MQNELTTYLDAFVASVDEGSFSAGARRLGITPPAVSKSVARLESGLGVRLFQRSTRSLSLTAEGERLYRQVRMPWAEVGDALAELQQGAGKPAGTLKVSMAPTVGRTYFVPLLAAFLERYPDIVPDIHFDNRQVDLIAEGFDVAIGGGVELTEGMVARELAQVKVVLVAAPDYLGRHGMPVEPGDLSRHRGLLRRAIGSGRLIPWVLSNTDGGEVVANVRSVGVMDDPEALARAAACGLGIALLPVPHVLPMLKAGELVRILPDWHAEARPLSIYYSSRKLLPAKVRVFVDFIVNEVRERGYRHVFTSTVFDTVDTGN